MVCHEGMNHWPSPRHQRADRRRHRGDQQLPAGEHGGRHDDLAALQDQRADGPAEAGAQAERKAQRRRGVGGQAGHHQQQHGGTAEEQAQQQTAAELFAQHRPGDQRRPQRHGETQHRRLPRRDEDGRIGAGDVPDHQVEEGGDDDGAPVFARNDQRLAARPRHRQQRDAGQQHRHGTEGPHRDLGHRVLEQRPVGAPHQRQHDQQDEGAARNALFGHAARLTAMGGQPVQRRIRRGRAGAPVVRPPLRVAPSAPSGRRPRRCAAARRGSAPRPRATVPAA